METELAGAVDVVMGRAKRTYILIIKGNKLFSFFSSPCFLKEMENMYSEFLSSYRNTRESLGELEKVLPNFHSCFYNSIETRYMFSIFLLLIDWFISCIWTVERKIRWYEWSSHLYTAEAIMKLRSWPSWVRIPSNPKFFRPNFITA